MKIPDWFNVIKDVHKPIQLLAFLSAIVATLILFTKDFHVTWVSLLILLIVTVACIVDLMKNKAMLPTEIRSIWSKHDLPLEKSEGDSWIGKWNCRWTYHTKDRQLKPYVDDIIEIEAVDYKSGVLSGIGHSSYVEGEKYYLRGRASRKGVAHIFYTSPRETAGLSGMVILNHPPIGEIVGWWIGVGRKREDIGGGVTMERHEKNTNFKLKTYEVT